MAGKAGFGVVALACSVGLLCGVFLLPTRLLWRGPPLTCGMGLTYSAHAPGLQGWFAGVPLQLWGWDEWTPKGWFRGASLPHS